MPRYRPDIDGLRAVAVLAVVAFHSGFRAVPGGFVGVDVFFVISGYLICGLVDREVREKRFSAAQFYRRRILRIAPAFVAVLLACVALAYAFLLPTELEDFARSLIAATLSSSNIFFAQQSGYFDAPALAKPLLHTWSLGVEEQFYLVFPFLLILLERWLPNRRRTVLAVLAALSLAAAALLGASRPVTVFYEMPFRFWELALGALAALGAFPGLSTTLARNGAAAAGLAMIAGAVFLVSDTTPFAVATLIPCLGALLVILAGERGSSLAGWGLSLPPVVFLGLISYSLYLWHWPIIVFQNADAVFLHDPGSPRTKLTLIAIAIGVAALSWRVIEQPFRGRSGARFPAARTFRWAATAAAVLVGLGIASLAIDGGAFRFPPEAVRVAAYLAYDPVPSFRQGRCFVHGPGEFDPATCLHLDAERPNVLLLGDSHAAHLWWGLSRTFTNVNVLQATASGCKPVIVPRLLESSVCRAVMTDMFDRFLTHNHVAAVILAAQWNEDDVPKIAVTVKRLQEDGVTPILVGPIPQYDYALPRLLADAIRYKDPTYPDAHLMKGLDELDTRMQDLAAREHVTYVSLMHLLCRNGRCEHDATPTVPLQFDSGHLTKEGSLLVAGRLDRDHALPWSAEPVQ